MTGTELGGLVRGVQGMTDVSLKTLLQKFSTETIVLGLIVSRVQGMTQLSLVVV